MSFSKEKYNQFINNHLKQFGNKQVVYLLPSMIASYKEKDLEELLDEAVKDNYLIKHCEYFIPSDYFYEDKSIEISMDEYNEMVEVGHFYNPETGKEDFNYKENINFFYSVTDKLIKLKEEGI